MRVLVTGGAGFIGTQLVKKLSESGHDVISIDNTINEKKFFEQGYLCLDICNYDHLTKLRRIIEGVDIVYHLAAKKDLQASFQRTILYHRTNVVGTINLLELCRDVGVKRFVLASTCAVYGETSATGIYREKIAPKPLSPYGLQKLTAEQYCEIYSKHHGVDCVSLRYFNVFGPGTNEGVIPTFLNQHKNKKPLTIFGTGEHSRDFVYVDDVVDATILAGEHNTEHNGDVFNIASGDCVSINEIAFSICETDEKIKRLTAQPEATFVCGNISKIKKVLKWKPKTDVLDWLSNQ